VYIILLRRRVCQTLPTSDRKRWFRDHCYRPCNHKRTVSSLARKSNDFFKVLATICLFPVDIALVSTTVNRATGLRKDWASPERVETIVLSLKVVYYGKHLLLSFRMRGIKVLEFGALTVTAVLYAIDSLFCLLIIPFTYFWYEEWDEESTLGSRVRGASKYSALFLLITLALLLTGFFIPISHDLTGGIDLDYLKHLLSENRAFHVLTLTHS